MESSFALYLFVQLAPILYHSLAGTKRVVVEEVLHSAKLR